MSCLALLKPCPDEALRIWPAAKTVGNVKNNGVQLLTSAHANAA